MVNKNKKNEMKKDAKIPILSPKDKVNADRKLFDQYISQHYKMFNKLKFPGIIESEKYMSEYQSTSFIGR